MSSSPHEAGRRRSILEDEDLKKLAPERSGPFSGPSSSAASCPGSHGIRLPSVVAQSTSFRRAPACCPRERRGGHACHSQEEPGRKAPCGTIKTNRERILVGPDAQRKKGCGGMDNDETWYRQLLALVLLSVSRAAVEFITNPSSKE